MARPAGGSAAVGFWIHIVLGIKDGLGGPWKAGWISFGLLFNSEGKCSVGQLRCHDVESSIECLVSKLEICDIHPPPPTFIVRVLLFAAARADEVLAVLGCAFTGSAVIDFRARMLAA